MRRLVLIAGLIVTALTIGAIYVLLIAPSDRPLQVGQKAPDFHLKGAFGGEGKLSDYRGKVVLLNFWATWCAPCVKEMPSLQTLYHFLGGDDFEIIAVSMDQEGASVVQDFARVNRLEFSLVTDPDSLTESLYHLTGLPESYLIDKDGVIREKVLGPRDWRAGDSVKLVTDLLGHGVPKRPKKSYLNDATAPTDVTAPAEITAPAPKPPHAPGKKKKKK